MAVNEEEKNTQGAGQENTHESERKFYREYEVFSKRSNKLPLQHQFSLLAPNKEMAMMMSQENFMRREDAIDIWVVERKDIRDFYSE